MEEIKKRVNNLIYSYRVSYEPDDNYDTYHLNYENKQYRQNELAGLIRDSVPYFALTKNEIREYTFFLSNLKRLTKFYVYNTPSIKQLIETQFAKRTDTKVRNTFKLMSHYFEYYLPKVLTAFQIIFNYVSEKNNRNSPS